MRLVLSVGGKVLDSIMLDPDYSKDSDYIHSLRRLLLLKHELSIIAMQQKTEFYIEALSAINPVTPLKRK